LGDLLKVPLLVFCFVAAFAVNAAGETSTVNFEINITFGQNIPDIATVVMISTDTYTGLKEYNTDVANGEYQLYL
jgi:hypothetical protein